MWIWPCQLVTLYDVGFTSHSFLLVYMPVCARVAVMCVLVQHHMYISQRASQTSRPCLNKPGQKGSKSGMCLRHEAAVVSDNQLRTTTWDDQVKLAFKCFRCSGRMTAEWHICLTDHLIAGRIHVQDCCILLEEHELADEVITQSLSFANTHWQSVGSLSKGSSENDAFC